MTHARRGYRVYVGFTIAGGHGTVTCRTKPCLDQTVAIGHGLRAVESKGKRCSHCTDLLVAEQVA